MNKINTEKSVHSLSLEEKIKKVLVNYLKTQFILIGITSFLSWGVLTLLNIKYALLLAILTGALSIIPNFGIIIATLVSSLVAIFDEVVFLPNSSPVVEGLVVLTIFIVLNKLLDFIVSPLLLGKTNKVSPTVIFLLVMLGTFAFGIPGAILSVPIFLVIKTVWVHYSE